MTVMMIHDRVMPVKKVMANAIVITITNRVRILW